MEKIPDLSVIILNYNTAALTGLSLESLFASDMGGYTMEVIVCDNGSQDGSYSILRKRYPRARHVDNKKNIGFAAGNNRGIRLARGRYILLLNSDTEVTPATLQTLIRFMDEHPDAGAATAKLVLPDGAMDPACHRGIPTPWAAFTYLAKLEKLFPASEFFGRYHQGYKDMSVTHEVDCISGAFFLVRRSVIEEVGELDEAFFMYGEDIDWSYRIRKAGWKIYFYPSVTVLHKKKQSGRANSEKGRRKIADIYFHRYNWLFFTKHFARSSGPAVRLMVNAFYTVRLFLLEKLKI